jgi:hypothetical protein
MAEVTSPELTLTLFRIFQILLRQHIGVKLEILCINYIFIFIYFLNFLNLGKGLITKIRQMLNIKSGFDFQQKLKKTNPL